jgi:hypothetical protein
MLPDVEKDTWRQKAAKELETHSQKYPNYKFTPAPRGSAKSRAKEVLNPSEIPEDAKERRIREIRERYTAMTGPAPPPARRRNKRAVRGREQEKSPPRLFLPSYPSVTLAAPKPRLSESRLPHWLSTSIVSAPYTCPSHFPSFPRRPSTSLGFSTSYEQTHSVSHPLRRSSSVGLNAGLASYGPPSENTSMEQVQHAFFDNYSMHLSGNETHNLAYTSGPPHPHHHAGLPPNADSINLGFAEARPPLAWETLFEPNINPFAIQSPELHYPAFDNNDCGIDPLFTPGRSTLT